MNEILEKLENDKLLTNGDFDKLGYSFEDFLRYAKASYGIRAQFHVAVYTRITEELNVSHE